MNHEENEVRRSAELSFLACGGQYINSNLKDAAMLKKLSRKRGQYAKYHARNAVNLFRFSAYQKAAEMDGENEVSYQLASSAAFGA